MGISPSSINDIRVWNGKVQHCTTKEAIPQLIKHYQHAKKDSVDKMKIQCDLNDESEPVTVTIRDKILGMPDDYMKNNGFIIKSTSALDLMKKIFHVKFKAKETKSCYALSFLFLSTLKGLGLINHSQACMIGTPSGKDKQKTLLCLELDSTPPEIHLKKLNKNGLEKDEQPTNSSTETSGKKSLQPTASQKTSEK
jgi:hypothetical protein